MGRYIMDAESVTALLDVLNDRGVDPCVGGGWAVDALLDRPWNFVLHDGMRLRVDLHLYESLSDGSLHYGSVINGLVFPAGALGGQGVIAGSATRCEAAEWTVRWHTGYPPRAVDRHDVALLCERFGIELPEAFG